MKQSTTDFRDNSVCYETFPKDFYGDRVSVFSKLQSVSPVTTVRHFACRKHFLFPEIFVPLFCYLELSCRIKQ
jgi:hypothetical protein